MTTLTHTHSKACCINLHQRFPAVGRRRAARDGEEEGDAGKDGEMKMNDQEGLKVCGYHLYLQQGPGSTGDGDGLQGSFPPPHGAISVHQSRHCKSKTRFPKEEKAECTCVCACVSVSE